MRKFAISKQIKQIRSLLALLPQTKSTQITWLVLCALLTVAFQSFIPIQIGRSIDSLTVLRQNPASPYLVQLLTIAGLALLSAGFRYLLESKAARLSYALAYSLRRQLFRKLQKLPLSALDQSKRGDFLHYLTGDIENICDGISLFLSKFLTGIFSILITMLLILQLQLQLALLIILLTPISVLAARFIASQSHRHFKAQAEKRSALSAYAEDQIHGIRSLKIAAAEDKSKYRFEVLNSQLEESSRRANFIASLSNPLNRFVSAIVYASIAVLGAHFAYQGKISIGILVSFLAYAQQYASPFNEISQVLSELQNARVSQSRLNELIERDEWHDCENPIGLPSSVDGSFTFEHVDFSYEPEKPLIQNLNLRIPAKSKVAIVGKTGSGKSTLINLLLRFYDANSGDIRIDSKSIYKVDRKDLRAHYALVLQESFLITASIADNIALGRPEASREEIIAAAKQARADGFISRLPNAYDTMIDADQNSLSEGERQLIALARLFLQTHDVLVLDEASSSIDTRSELSIQATLNELMDNKSAFIVAHRLQSIQDADLILMVDSGKIVEIGRHEELMAKRTSAYRRLYLAQFAPLKNKTEDKKRPQR
ncbi:MAG: ABC transporter ATP-binding protein [Eubacteriales bacterium]|nr:ABC transporter ATP-binding protein [Eubacteriales bacterium]